MVGAVGRLCKKCRGRAQVPQCRVRVQVARVAPDVVALDVGSLVPLRCPLKCQRRACVVIEHHLTAITECAQLASSLGVPHEREIAFAGRLRHCVRVNEHGVGCHGFKRAPVPSAPSTVESAITPSSMGVDASLNRTGRSMVAASVGASAGENTTASPIRSSMTLRPAAIHDIACGRLSETVRVAG